MPSQAHKQITQLQTHLLHNLQCHNTQHIDRATNMKFFQLVSVALLALLSLALVGPPASPHRAYAINDPRAGLSDVDILLSSSGANTNMSAFTTLNRTLSNVTNIHAIPYAWRGYCDDEEDLTGSYSKKRGDKSLSSRRR